MIFYLELILLWSFGACNFFVPASATTPQTSGTDSAFESSRRPIVRRDALTGTAQATVQPNGAIILEQGERHTRRADPENPENQEEPDEGVDERDTQDTADHAREERKEEDQQTQNVEDKQEAELGKEEHLGWNLAPQPPSNPFAVGAPVENLQDLDPYGKTEQNKDPMIPRDNPFAARPSAEEAKPSADDAPLDPPDEEEPVGVNSLVGEDSANATANSTATPSATVEALCEGGWKAGAALSDKKWEIGCDRKKGQLGWGHGICSRNSCVSKCSTYKGANGATFHDETKKCFCELGQWELNAGSASVNCLFPEVESPTMVPTWGAESLNHYCSGSYESDLEASLTREKKTEGVAGCKVLCEQNKDCTGIVFGNYQGIENTCVVCTSDTWSTGKIKSPTEEKLAGVWTTVSGYEFDHGPGPKRDPDEAVQDVINNPPRDPLEVTERMANMTALAKLRNPPVTNNSMWKDIEGKSAMDPHGKPETKQQYEKAVAASPPRRRGVATEPSNGQYLHPTPAPTHPKANFFEEAGYDTTRTRFLSETFPRGTDLCPHKVGHHYCSFDSFELAKHFCEIRPTCLIVIKQNPCTKGCYIPRQGTLVDPGASRYPGRRSWLRQNPRTADQIKGKSGKPALQENTSEAAPDRNGLEDNEAAKAAVNLRRALGNLDKPTKPDPENVVPTSLAQVQGAASDALRQAKPHNDKHHQHKKQKQDQHKHEHKKQKHPDEQKKPHHQHHGH